MIVIDKFDPKDSKSAWLSEIDADRRVYAFSSDNGFAILVENGTFQQRMAFSREGAEALVDVLLVALEETE